MAAKDRKGRAPNKPLLVLAILDLVEAGLVGPEGLVHKDVQLSLRFRSYSPICVPRRGNGIDLNLPFRHLASDGVYSHLGEGERTVKLDPVLLASMRVPAWRQEARRRVVAARSRWPSMRPFADEIPYPRVVYYRCGSALTDGWIL